MAYYLHASCKLSKQLGLVSFSCLSFPISPALEGYYLLAVLKHFLLLELSWARGGQGLKITRLLFPITSIIHRTLFIFIVFEIVWLSTSSSVNAAVNCVIDFCPWPALKPGFV